MRNQWVLAALAILGVVGVVVVTRPKAGSGAVGLVSNGVPTIS